MGISKNPIFLNFLRCPYPNKKGAEAPFSVPAKADQLTLGSNSPLS